ncbi:D-alanyl-D-alanine carboxypeptidase [Bacillus sp. FJAT-27231]|uniref:D-alanyl-D-alanine carboxypeptidase family protein n=1 Tax=Bacillus sp. FJAT-27231 TaxID=1679168 RepID=UPI0006713F6C|nr:D-alanyl-D-alanine carboxypeptidase family protein [Bacillus sp. FJAT-27231]KMY54657.1 D-alanyl-D-alanine carboxypeptidase [Bacillus sp. FJAT-27231]
MKKKLPIAILAFLLFLATGTPAAAEPSAASAVLMEQQSGRVLYAKNPHAVMRIASITKIMTAIIAIESDKLDEKVKVSERAVHTEGSSVYLKKGEKIPLEDLVYGLMLRSGNDAAVAIAEHVGGSLEGFVYLMNEKAKEIGMKHTYFANPHGLDDSEKHRSTAYDMALLTRYAMKNAEYRKISGTEVYRSPDPDGEWDRIWYNKNRLLTEKYKYCTGGKTGYTKKAKRTLVTTATKGDLDLIAVTLNAPDDWNDHIYLYEQGFLKYDPKIILQKGEVKAGNHPFYKGNIYLKRDVVYPLTKKEEKQVAIRFHMLKPKKQWQNGEVPPVVGQAEVYLKKEKLYSLPVYYKNEQKKQEPSIWEKWKEWLPWS